MGTMNTKLNVLTLSIALAAIAAMATTTSMTTMIQSVNASNDEEHDNNSDGYMERGDNRFSDNPDNGANSGKGTRNFPDGDCVVHTVQTPSGNDNSKVDC